MKKWITILPSLLLVACQGAIASTGTDAVEAEEVDELHGSVNFTSSRQLRRLSADQFVKSLELATGQSWKDSGKYAEAMGKPDLMRSPEEGRELSVTFDKLAQDAAFATCAQSVDETPDVLLRHATLQDRDPSKLYENIRYLYLRFLTKSLASKGDIRAKPWMNLLVDGDEEVSDAQMKDRWIALCVGLATHPDFYVY